MDYVRRFEMDFRESAAKLYPVYHLSISRIHYSTRNTLEAGAWVLSSGRQGYFRIHGHQDARIGLARIFSIARDFPMQFTRGAIVFNGMAVSVVVFLMWC
uniref:Uncharacterized protein n=1 Tax=Candidatus Kentrum sp. SD TaxID=2126332 RepID=A0A451BSX8_9GAMM|nr:MAG: hypothetical protein BECKSD772D_GA0070982_13442 [Candidatus Kentron sp. SD]